MKLRTEAQQQRLDELLANGWQIVDEYPLLGIVSLVRPVHDGRLTRFEHLTLSRTGRTTWERRP